VPQRRVNRQALAREPAGEPVAQELAREAEAPRVVWDGRGDAVDGHEVRHDGASARDPDARRGP
jgi:hypothetical protein